MEKFKRYSSLTNHTQQKFIDILVMNDLTKGEWVTQEKIHGANFSFWFDGETHRQAKRSSFCEENFFNCQAIMKYRVNIENIYKFFIAKNVLEEGETMVVYGEIFGGKFKNQKEPNAKTVQSNGADYHPDNEFMAFDIKVNGQFLPFIDVDKVCRIFKLPIAPVIEYGTFEDLMALPNDFNSYVPEDFGLNLDGLDENIAEGLVIRPALGDLRLRGERVIIKSKNSKFSEKGGKPCKIDVPLTDNEKALLKSFSKYFTPQRVDATISKVGQVENWKQFAQIAGLTFKDAIEEYEEDNFNGVDDDRTFKSILGDSYSMFNKVAKFESDKVVRETFKKLL